MVRSLLHAFLSLLYAQSGRCADNADGPRQSVRDLAWNSGANTPLYSNVENQQGGCAEKTFAIERKRKQCYK